VVGRWRIVEMELWDRDSIDLVGPRSFGAVWRHRPRVRNGRSGRDHSHERIWAHFFSAVENERAQNRQ
jgi:hypothetical protein